MTRWVYLLALGAVAALLWPRWGAFFLDWWPGGDWSTAHLPILKAAAVAMAWHSTRNPGDSAPRLGWLGALCCLLSAVATLALSMHTLAMVLWLAALWCGLGWVWGAAALRRSWPAAVLLLMTLPRTSDLVQVAAPMLMAEGTAMAAEAAMSALGRDVLREGVHLLLPGTTLTVALHCAGVQYLEVFLTLLLVRLWLHGPPKHPGAYVPSALLAGVFLNVLRVTLFALLITGGTMMDPEALDATLGMMVMLLGVIPLWLWPSAQRPATE